MGKDKDKREDKKDSKGKREKEDNPNEISSQPSESLLFSVASEDPEDSDKKEKKIGKKSGKKKMAKWQKGLILTILIFVVLAVAISQLTGKTPPTMVTTGTVEITDIEQVATIKGVVKGTDSANIYSSSTYRIADILVKEGDKVSHGQILATLDAQDLMDKYAQALITVEQTAREYENSEVLYEAGAISKSDYLKAKDAYASAQLAANAYNLKEATNVTSPIAGTVTRVNASIGKIAGGSGNSDPLFVVENLDKLQMKVGISEFEIRNIKEGQKVIIAAEVLGDRKVSGVVAGISPTGEKKDATSAEMVIPVTIAVDEGTEGLISGITAKATILIDSREKVLTVPVDAILENPETGETYVFKVDDKGILIKKPVKIGLEGNLAVEILQEGIKKDDRLKAGDRIVLAPTLMMTEGMKVVDTNVTGGAFSFGGKAATSAGSSAASGDE